MRDDECCSKWNNTSEFHQYPPDCSLVRNSYIPLVPCQRPHHVSKQLLADSVRVSRAPPLGAGSRSSTRATGNRRCGARRTGSCVSSRETRARRFQVLLVRNALRLDGFESDQTPLPVVAVELGIAGLAVP